MPYPVASCRNFGKPATIGGAFTYDNWVNGEPGVTSHVWTLRLPKSYDGTSASLMLEGNTAGQQTIVVGCDVDTAGLRAADGNWEANFFLDGGAPPVVNDAGTEWEWVFTIDSSNVPADANRSAGSFA